MTAQSVILTAIKFRGLQHVSDNAKNLAEGALCSESYVKSIVAKVKSGKIIIK